jgi:hypothetical protein
VSTDKQINEKMFNITSYQGNENHLSSLRLYFIVVLIYSSRGWGKGEEMSNFVP